jgi:hypothetical protein
MPLRVRTPLVSAIVILCGTLASPMGCTRTETPPAATIDVTTVNFAELLDELANEHQARANQDPLGVNAYPIIIDACRLHFETLAGLSNAQRVDFAAIYDSSVASPGGTNDDAARAATAALEALDRAGVFDLLDQVAAAPRAVRTRLDAPERDAERAALGSTDPWDGNLIGATLPEIQHIRMLARACAARMHIAAGANDPDAFIRAFAQGLALSRAQYLQPWMIDSKVGADLRELILTRAYAGLGELELTEAHFETIQAAVDTQTKGLPGMDFAFHGERLAVLDMCRWAFDSRGKFQPKRLIDAGMLANVPPRSDPAHKARRDANVQRVESCYGDIINAVVQPRATRPDADALVRTQIAAGPAADVVMLGYVGASGRYLKTMDAAALDLAGFRVVLAVERFERAMGQYPDTLEQVVSRGLLDQIPDDAIASGPIRYRKLDAAADGAARAYIVYSVGADGVDDSGGESPDAKVDVRFDAVAGKGFDYVFNAAP